MTVKIAIIGLGQIGASIGLALASNKELVTTFGYDKADEISRQAQKMEAVENVAHSLSACIKEAGVIVLALPFDQVQETLKAIAQDVRDEAVVIDMAPAKQAAADWAKEILPPTCHYIGLTPALNPRTIDQAGSGIAAARADLFQNGLMAVTAPHGEGEGVIKLAIGLVNLLGARAYFADMAEVDGIMATIQTLPALAAAALMETVIDQPGWPDIRKLAGRPFVAAMRPFEAEDPAALAEAARQNCENTVRVLNNYIATLQSLRDEIAGEEKKDLGSHLERILLAGAQWRRARADGDWQNIESLEQNIPTFSELSMQQLGLGKLLGFGRKKKE